MRYLVLLFLSPHALAGNWVHAPSGVLPQPGANFLTYTQNCGTDCYQIDPDGVAIPMDYAKIENGKIAIDQAKKDIYDQAEATRQAATVARRQRLKEQIDSADTVAKIRALLKDLYLETAGR